MEKRKKSIAPQEPGELPNEHRCKNCMSLLSHFEYEGKISLWCLNCQIGYGEIPEKAIREWTIGPS